MNPLLSASVLMYILLEAEVSQNSCLVMGTAIQQLEIQYKIHVRTQAWITNTSLPVSMWVLGLCLHTCKMA